MRNKILLPMIAGALFGLIFGPGYVGVGLALGLAAGLVFSKSQRMLSGAALAGQLAAWFFGWWLVILPALAWLVFFFFGKLGRDMQEPSGLIEKGAPTINLSPKSTNTSKFWE